ncbi:hypothetical protein F4814DRAFT_458437 [Daldinia grandis]|nr:hypothetical protein F4814DRAFT_458437 [Daldinia grandis]
MRLPIRLILAAVCCFIAGSVGAGISSFPRETGAVAGAAIRAGWSPKPTPAPGAAKPEEDHVLDVLLVRGHTNLWTNNETCGWIPGPSSYPVTCGERSTCATNSDYIVACVSGTVSPFFSICLDFSAYERGSCDDHDTGAGCCTERQYGSCATYFWTSSPARSMYRCSNVSTAITMLDVPQFVVDASLSASAAQTAIDIEPLSSGVYPGSEQPSPSSNTISVGAIMGCVIGGIICLIFIGYMLLSCRAYRMKAKADHNNVQTRLDNAFHQPPTLPRVRSFAMSAFEPEPSTPSAQRQPDASSSIYSQDSITPILPSHSANRVSASVYTRVAPESPDTPLRRTLYVPSYGRHSTRVPTPPGYEWHEMHVRARPESSPVHGYNTPPPRYSLYPAVGTRLTVAEIEAAAESCVHGLVQDEGDAVIWVDGEQPATGSLSAEGRTGATRDLK